MSKAKIYTASPSDLSPPVQSESFCVDLVLASDYLALEAKCVALAAENAGMKNPDNWIAQSDYGYEAAEVAAGNGVSEDEALRAGMIAIINRIQTSATDAFLAEVRAQGVERYAAQLKSEAELADETGWDGAAKFLISESEKVLAFAAQIRQEAAQ
ncbi:TPA: hypothetical protein N2F43_003986 [Salmonella enterica]|nr:hypothetical protein [Salmonella enterica]